MKLSNSILEKKNDDLMQEMMEQLQKTAEIRERQHLSQKLEKEDSRKVEKETKNKCLM